MPTTEKLFEKWMKKEFDEPDWYEGYNRGDMIAAFKAAFKAGQKKARQKIQESRNKK